MQDMQIQQETLTDKLIHEIEPMLDAYYMTTVAKTDIPPYDFDWPAYMTLQEHGHLVATTVRLHGLLIGFTIYIVMTLPHHKTKTVAECDCIAVDPAFRNVGIGRKLYTFNEDILRSMNVDIIIQRYRVCYGAEPIFPKLGFKHIEQLYMKEL